MKPAPAPAKNRDRLWAVLLLAATLFAYRPAWKGQPLWDDAAHITKPALRSAAGLAAIWTQPGATQQYYPLLHSAFWLQYHLWGESTAGYHLVSILLHFASALLLLRILRKLQVAGAWLAAALFALHPVMVESVAWMTELKNTLSAVFFLAAASKYLSFDDKRETKDYAAALLLFVAGLLAKSVIATLPPALLVVLWWKRGRLAVKRDVLPLLPFFLVGAISGLFTAWVERRFIGAEGGEFNFTLVERCLIAGRAIWFYLYKLLWPANLVFVYPRWHIDSHAVWQYLFPAALLPAAFFAYRFRSRSRAPLAVLLYFVATLFPALGFFNVYPFRYSFVADHFQYLAAIGPLTAAAAAIVQATNRLKNRWRPLPPLLQGVLLSAFCLLSSEQSRMYADAESLYRATIAGNGDCWMAHTHLGLLLIDKGRHEEAMAHLQKALELHPNQADAHNNLGLLLTDLGRPVEAMAHLRKALELNPNQADAHTNLGVVLARTGNTDEAMAHYRTALALHPDHAEVHYNLADLLARMGRTDEAVAHYRRALDLHPEYTDAHNNLGLLLANTERPREAIAHFRRALEINPKHANAHNNLGVMLRRLGQTDEALAHHRRAWEIDPLEISHLENFVFALLKNGRAQEAATVLQNTLEIARSTGDEARAKKIAQTLAEVYEGIGSAQTTSPTLAR